MSQLRVRRLQRDLGTLGLRLTFIPSRASDDGRIRNCTIPTDNDFYMNGPFSGQGLERFFYSEVQRLE